MVLLLALLSVGALPLLTGCSVRATSAPLAAPRPNAVLAPSVIAPGSGSTITFIEYGLPASSNWSVFVMPLGSGSGANASTTSGQIAVRLANGEYDYALRSTTSDIADPGRLIVNGSSFNVSVTFGLPETVAFVESGLPAGAQWYANLTLNQAQHLPPSALVITWALGASTGSAINLTVTQGSYGYSVAGPAGSYANVSLSGGTLYVNGTVTVPVRFSATNTSGYRISFVEANLPIGRNWSVSLVSNTTQVAWTNGSTIVFDEPNATYGYAVPSVGNYVPAPNLGGNVVNGTLYGTVTANGSAVSVPVDFCYVRCGSNATPTNYSVTFSESGLPTNLGWSVVLAGVTGSAPANSTHITFSEPNGSYTFVVASGGAYSPSPSNGSLIVSGSSVSVPVTFTSASNGGATQYTITFSETGLSNGTNWSVSVGQSAHSSTGTSLAIAKANGSYTWTAFTTVNGTAYNVSGRVSVSGAAVRVSVAFQVPAALYPLALSAYSSSPIAAWTVTLTATSAGEEIELASGVTRGASNGGTVTFWVANGTYDYSISATGYRSPVTGTVSVAGSGKTVGVALDPVAPRPSSGPTSQLVEGNAFVGIGLAAVAVLGLAGYGLAARNRERGRARQLLERISRTEWAADESGEPTLRSDH